MDKRLTYKTKFKIRSHDLDANQELSPMGMMRMMHEAAFEHVQSIPETNNKLKEGNLGWIVLNQRFNFYNTAKVGDQIKLITYPSGIERIFTYRDYLVINQNDEIIGNSCGKFIMMNLDNRSMANIPREIAEIIEDAQSQYDIERPDSLSKLKSDQLINQTSFEVRYSDIDLNNHVGNQVYYRWILDSAITISNSRHLKDIQLEFKGEAKLGDTVICSNYFLDEHNILHIIDSENKTICRGVSNWK